MPKRQRKCLKRELCGDAVPRVVRAKVAPRYVEEFCSAGMSREFAAAVQARYEMDGISSGHNSLLTEQYPSVRSLSSEHVSSVLEGMDDEEDSWDLKGKVAAEELTTSGICSKFGEVRRACVDGDKIVPTTIVKVIDLTCEGVEAKRIKATLSNRRADMEATLV